MNLQLWTVSKLTRLPFALRRDLRFYAPLQEHLDFYGIDPVTFARTGAANATWRDGQTHSVPANNPRFEYSGELPLGLLVESGETLQYASANGLDDANTLIWFEEDSPKSTPTNSNPFSSTGIWTGNLDIHVKHVTKAIRVLSNAEIVTIQNALDDIDQAIAPPPPPPAPGATPGSFFKEVPAGVRNGSNVTFTLSNDPELDSLLVICFGVVLERVASAPAEMEFTAGGTGNRTLTLGLGPTTDYPFFAQYIVA